MSNFNHIVNKVISKIKELGFLGFIVLPLKKLKKIAYYGIQKERPDRFL